MNNTIKKCTPCKGKGIINANKMDARGGTTCPVCKGFGVPIYDETYDNALDFLQEEEKDIIELNDDEE